MLLLTIILLLRLVNKAEHKAISAKAEATAGIGFCLYVSLPVCGSLRSKAHVRLATNSPNFIAQLNRATNLHIGNCRSFPSSNSRPTNMASSDTDDHITISSAFLITSAITLHQSQQLKN